MGHSRKSFPLSLSLSPSLSILLPLNPLFLPLIPSHQFPSHLLSARSAYDYLTHRSPFYFSLIFSFLDSVTEIDEDLVNLGLNFQIRKSNDDSKCPLKTLDEIYRYIWIKRDKIRFALLNSGNSKSERISKC